MEKMKIEIWSDIACPYCYIGKRMMEKALSRFPNRDEVELVWHSYELNPDLPKKPLSESIYEFMANQYGVSIDKQKKTMQGIADLAKSCGLEYNFDKRLVTNTSDALRLVKLANKYNLADEAEEILFKAYFTDGKDVSDRTVLVELGRSIGIDEKEINSMLNSDQFIAEIKEDIRYSEEALDLQYIPFYLFNNKNVIQGSLTVEEYSEVLDKSYQDWKQNGISSDGGDRITGKACSIDGTCSI